ncbi:hypothetical protein QZH41_017469, partial [Actinostola sp. cb2023]
AYEKRFPTCPLIPVFLGSELVSEYKSEDGAEHVLERRCKLDVDAPYLLKKIIGVEFVYFNQTNSLNRRERTLAITAYNESFSSRVGVIESCYYSVHPDNPDWTCFEQDAKLDIKSFFGFEAAVEKLAIRLYLQNIKKVKIRPLTPDLLCPVGKEVIQYYIDELISEGVSHITLFPGAVSKPRTRSLLLENVPEGEDATVLVPIASSALESTEVDSTALQGKASRKHCAQYCWQLHDFSIVYLGNLLCTTCNIAKLGSLYLNCKLDDVYIQRFLGKLNPKEENQLIQLRKKLSAAHQGKMPNDAHLLRFLRARDFNLEKAYDMLCQSLAWRRHHHIDEILETWKPPEHLLEYYCGGWHHHDKEGRPVYILRLGSMDVKGLLKAVGEDGFLKHVSTNVYSFVVSTNEEGLKRTENLTKETGQPISSWTCICDLEGLSMRHLWRPGIKALLHVIEMVECNYPETMGRLLIVRAPRIFGVLWTLGLGGLTDYIDGEFIPDFLGGPAECAIKEGRLVPKNLYRSIDFDEGEQSFGSDIYHTAHVNKGTPYEVLISITESESVITWDFDVMKGDVTFTVFRHKRPREAMSSTSVNSLGSNASLNQSGVIAGVDAVVVEKPRLCIDGESVQGTHVSSIPGVYVLQWKFKTGLPSGQAHARHNRAKVMYYHEVLASGDFRFVIK